METTEGLTSCKTSELPTKIKLWALNTGYKWNDQYKTWYIGDRRGLADEFVWEKYLQKARSIIPTEEKTAEDPIKTELRTIKYVLIIIAFILSFILVTCLKATAQKTDSVKAGINFGGITVSAGSSVNRVGTGFGENGWSLTAWSDGTWDIRGDTMEVIKYLFKKVTAPDQYCALIEHSHAQLQEKYNLLIDLYNALVYMDKQIGTDRF
jgi:hypothetical protein